LNLKDMKKIAFLIIAASVGYVSMKQQGTVYSKAGLPPAAESSNDEAFAQAKSRRASGVSLQGQGTVVKVLADDKVGSQHQKFILKLDSQQTVLIAHNIDIARRIAGLKAGDRVAFKGEYEWNSKGGVIHWTHHDPGGRHASGWLKHGGQVFQ
jgi:Protein of unknown function (DUF3465)